MSSYFELFKKGENLIEIRLKMVKYANKHGIRAAAKYFETTEMTVRKWKGRFVSGKKADLKSKPKHVLTPGSTRYRINEKRILAIKRRQKRARLAEKKRLEKWSDWT